MKTVILHGALGNKFGREWSLEANSISEVISAIKANQPEFQSYVVNQSINGVEYVFKNDAGVVIGNEEFDLKRKSKENLHIFPLLSGSATKIQEFASTGVPSAISSFFMSKATSYIMKKLFPEDSESKADEVETNSFLYSGAENVQKQGVAIPIGYGRLRVGSRVISNAQINLDFDYKTGKVLGVPYDIYKNKNLYQVEFRDENGREINLKELTSQEYKNQIPTAIAGALDEPLDPDHPNVNRGLTGRGTNAVAKSSQLHGHHNDSGEDEYQLSTQENVNNGAERDLDDVQTNEMGLNPYSYEEEPSANIDKNHAGAGGNNGNFGYESDKVDSNGKTTRRGGFGIATVGHDEGADPSEIAASNESYEYVTEDDGTISEISIKYDQPKESKVDFGPINYDRENWPSTVRLAVKKMTLRDISSIEEKIYNINHKDLTIYQTILKKEVLDSESFEHKYNYLGFYKAFLPPSQDHTTDTRHSESLDFLPLHYDKNEKPLLRGRRKNFTKLESVGIYKSIDLICEGPIDGFCDQYGNLQEFVRQDDSMVKNFNIAKVDNVSDYYDESVGGIVGISKTFNGENVEVINLIDSGAGYISAPKVKFTHRVKPEAAVFSLDQENDLFQGKFLESSSSISYLDQDSNQALLSISPVNSGLGYSSASASVNLPIKRPCVVTGLTVLEDVQQISEIVHNGNEEYSLDPSLWKLKANVIFDSSGNFINAANNQLSENKLKNALSFPQQDSEEAAVSVNPASDYDSAYSDDSQDFQSYRLYAIEKSNLAQDSTFDIYINGNQASFTWSQGDGTAEFASQLSSGINQEFGDTVNAEISGSTDIIVKSSEGGMPGSFTIHATAENGNIEYLSTIDVSTGKLLNYASVYGAGYDLENFSKYKIWIVGEKDGVKVQTAYFEADIKNYQSPAPGGVNYSINVLDSQEENGVTKPILGNLEGDLSGYEGKDISIYLEPPYSTIDDSQITIPNYDARGNLLNLGFNRLNDWDGTWPNVRLSWSDNLGTGILGSVSQNESAEASFEVARGRIIGLSINNHNSRYIPGETLIVSLPFPGRQAGNDNGSNEYENLIKINNKRSTEFIDLGSDNLGQESQDIINPGDSSGEGTASGYGSSYITPESPQISISCKNGRVEKLDFLTGGQNYSESDFYLQSNSLRPDLYEISLLRKGIHVNCSPPDFLAPRFRCILNEDENSSGNSVHRVEVVSRGRGLPRDNSYQLTLDSPTKASSETELSNNWDDFLKGVYFNGIPVKNTTHYLHEDTGEDNEKNTTSGLYNFSLNFNLDVASQLSQVVGYDSIKQKNLIGSEYQKPLDFAYNNNYKTININSQLFGPRKEHAGYANDDPFAYSNMFEETNVLATMEDYFITHTINNALVDSLYVSLEIKELFYVYEGDKEEVTIDIGPYLMALALYTLLQGANIGEKIIGMLKRTFQGLNPEGKGDKEKGLKFWGEKIEGVLNIIKAILALINTAIGTFAPQAFTSAITLLINTLSAILSNIKEVFNAFFEPFEKWVKKIYDTGKAFYEKLTDFADDMGLLGDIYQSGKNILSTFLGAGYDIIKSLISTAITNLLDVGLLMLIFSEKGLKFFKGILGKILPQKLYNWLHFSVGEKIENSGEIWPCELKFRIEVSNEELDKRATIVNFNAIAKSSYVKDVRIDLPPNPYKLKRIVKVSRLTRESDPIIGGEEEARYNRTAFLKSITEITPSILNYPNSVVIGSRINAKDLPFLPKREFDLRLKTIALPSNYDPEIKEYTGIWNGLFHGQSYHNQEVNENYLQWSDNPAWCIYDLLTNKRYGSGKYGLNAENVDKWNLYELGKYCDELVYSGRSPKFPFREFVISSHKNDLGKVLIFSSISENNFKKEFGRNAHILKGKKIAILGAKNSEGSRAKYIRIIEKVNPDEKKVFINKPLPFKEIDLTGEYESIDTSGGTLVNSTQEEITISDSKRRMAVVEHSHPVFESRFSLNVLIQDRQEAIKLVTSLSHLFNAMIYIDDGKIVFNQDKEKEPVLIFTNSNISDEGFSYSSTRQSERPTVVVVKYNDATDDFQQKIEYVEDPEGVSKFGFIEYNLAPMGLTSKGQARRAGRYLLDTFQKETEGISFRTSLIAQYLKPGDLIKVVDNNKIPKRYGGRVMGINSVDHTVDIDFPISDIIDETDERTHLKVYFYNPEENLSLDQLSELSSVTESNLKEFRQSQIFAFKIFKTSNNNETLHLSFDSEEDSGKYLLQEKIDNIPLGSAWVIDNENSVFKSSKMYKIISVQEVNNTIFEVEGLEYVDNKFTSPEEEKLNMIIEGGSSETDLKEQGIVFDDVDSMKEISEGYNNLSTYYRGNYLYIDDKCFVCVRESTGHHPIDSGSRNYWVRDKYRERINSKKSTAFITQINLSQFSEKNSLKTQFIRRSEEKIVTGRPEPEFHPKVNTATSVILNPLEDGDKNEIQVFQTNLEYKNIYNIGDDSYSFSNDAIFKNNLNANDSSKFYLKIGQAQAIQHGHINNPDWTKGVDDFDNNQIRLRGSISYEDWKKGVYSKEGFLEMPSAGAFFLISLQKKGSYQFKINAPKGFFDLSFCPVLEEQLSVTHNATRNFTGFDPNKSYYIDGKSIAPFHGMPIFYKEQENSLGVPSHSLMKQMTPNLLAEEEYNSISNSPKNYWSDYQNVGGIFDVVSGKNYSLHRFNLLSASALRNTPIKGYNRSDAIRIYNPENSNIVLCFIRSFLPMVEINQGIYPNSGQDIYAAAREMADNQNEERFKNEYADNALPLGVLSTTQLWKKELFDEKFASIEADLEIRYLPNDKNAFQSVYNLLSDPRT